MSPSRKKNSQAASSGGSKACPEVPSTAAPAGGKKWVIVQLSPAGEREKNIAAIIRTARHILGNKTVEVCVPAVSQKVREDSHTMFFWDGYIFVAHIEGLPYLRMNETTYFQNVLVKPGIVKGKQRSFSFLDDSELEPMRRGLEQMKMGQFQEDDEVKIIKGEYKNLVGVISCVYEDGESVQVYIALRSKKILMDFPASCLVRINT